MAFTEAERLSHENKISQIISIIVKDNKFTILICGFLDFSHLTELENIYVTEIYMKKKKKKFKRP